MKLKQRCSLVVALGIFSLAIPLSTVYAQEKATLVGSDTCVACHSEKAESYKKSLHGKKMPLAKKVAFEQACESCHGAGSLHAAAGGDKANPGFSTIKSPAKMTGDEIAKNCLSCHKQKEVMLWDTSSHAAKGITCTKCHSVHDGKGPKNLKLGSTETCLQCHKNKKAEMNLPSHHPVLEGKMACVSCHNPHGGVEGNLKGETLNETCFKCHAEKAGPFAWEHAPVTESCANCHKPHGSINQSLLKQSQPYLCLRCHKNEHSLTANGVKSRSGSKTVNPGNYSQDAANIATRSCSDCHIDIHGSETSNAFGH